MKENLFRTGPRRPRRRHTLASGGDGIKAQPACERLS